MSGVLHRRMPDHSLKDWLDCLESRHPVEIDLGLERVAAVASRLQLFDQHIHTFSIAGTNGKGSVAAVLTAGLVAEGYCVGTYTSPHLVRFNERIQIDGEMVDDTAIVAGFEAVEAAREDISLTYFETATLAALWIFRARGVDQRVLEVGLGGRLDAVNIIDADVSVITSIGLDHTDWLGESREVIAVEKAGIARSGLPCVVAEPDPPITLVRALSERGAIAHYLGQDWRIIHGNLRTMGGARLQLPQSNGLLDRNVGAALQAIECSGSGRLSSRLREAVSGVRLPGRLTELEIGGVHAILDVAHNTESVVALVNYLRQNPSQNSTRAIFGVMRDKPVHDMIDACSGVFDEWNLISLPDVPRAMQIDDLGHKIGREPVITTGVFGEVWSDVLRRSEPGDRIVVFGSFYTVSEALRFLDRGC